MSLKRLRPFLLPLLLLASSAAFAAPFKVCPASGKVRLIYICVGAPKDLVYLAPDDDSGNYSLGGYYEQGEFITIRCELHRRPGARRRTQGARRNLPRCRQQTYGQQSICQ
ncbi:hypothetical protein ACLIIZ_06945 [Azonexus caeni]|jgi:hypothetical protein|uniref:hypothetical protein n=1 Tax=Azonexus caeni TaxID=266126 RepID=UPI003A869759